jgi:acyl-CoA thioesterase YciA
MTTEKTTQSNPTLIVTPRPNDLNPSGDVFGGWLLSHLDVAGAICATKATKRKVVTVAVKDMQFRKPIFVQDIVNIYTEVMLIGKTSITIKLTAYADRNYGHGEHNVLVADAIFVYVAISTPGVKEEI